MLCSSERLQYTLRRQDSSILLLPLYSFDTSARAVLPYVVRKCTRTPGTRVGTSTYREMKGPSYGNTPHFYSGDASYPLWCIRDGAHYHFRAKEADAGEVSSL